MKKLPQSENVINKIEHLLLKEFPQLSNEKESLREKFELFPTKEWKFGHLASNIALKLAKTLSMKPRDIAQNLSDELIKCSEFKKVEVAGPGFLNFTFSDESLLEALDHILESGTTFGTSTCEDPKTINLEFVSSNPTGPVNVVSGRAAALGDALAEIFKATGHQVRKEFYVNNMGNQVEKLTQSFKARLLEILGEKGEIPDGGYQGHYIIPFAQNYIDSYGVEKNGSEILPVEGSPSFRDYILDGLITSQKEDLKNFRVEFDEWFFESTLHEAQKPQALLKKAATKNLSYEKDGATFLKTSELGDEKDRVLVKSDGQLTYFTNDIAYHQNKIERGANHLIDIWGPDHHGHVKRMTCALKALSDNEPELEVLIAQQVSLLEDGESVKMGKRLGKTVNLSDFMSQVPVDAIRYFFLERTFNSHLDFDIKLAVSQDKNNPVYYVQYAHARICQLLKKAKSEDAITLNEGDIRSTDNRSEFFGELEQKIVWHLFQYPQILQGAAISREPSKVVQYLYETASLLQHFYQNKKNPRILERSKEELTFLLKILVAVRQVLLNGLTLLHIEAKEKM